MSASSVETVAATLLALVVRTGAESGTVVLDRGEGQPPLLLDAVPDGVTVQEGEVSAPLELTAPPAPLPHLHAFEPMEVDATRAEITAPLGAVASLAGGVLTLAERAGGRSVATLQWVTSDADAPLALAARLGEPMIVALGEEQFEMPAGWP